MVSKRRWSDADVSFLTDNYGKVYSRFIAEKLGRSIGATQSKARSIGLNALDLFGLDRIVKDYTYSSDLSYLIGAILGDGYVHYYLQKKPKKSPHYYVKLSAKDFEFVSAVREAIGKVVGRYNKIQKLRQHKKSIWAGNRIFRVQVSDKSLFYLLKKSLDDLKPYIEAFPCDFLRGFFDAEGSAWIVDRKTRARNYVEPVVKYCNTDKELMDYVRELLVSLDIHPAPKMFVTKGNLCEDPKPCYNLHIYRFDSVRRFMDIIGSSISRKMLSF